jgi:hypothetical protein
MLSKLINMAWDFFVEVFGASTWEEIKKTGWPSMLAAILYAGWDIVCSPLGPMLFVNFLAVFALGLLVTNQIQLHRLREKWKRGEIPIPPVLQSVQEEVAAARQQIAELQAKIAAIEDARPYLVVECFSSIRHIRADRQPPIPPAQRVLRRSDRNGCLVSLALLRVINKPRNCNKDAVARRLSAWISYCDSEGKEIFPRLPGMWVSLDNKAYAFEIGGLSQRTPDLEADDFTYLGVAIGEFSQRSGGRFSLLTYGPFTARSHQCLGWVDPDYFLNEHKDRGNIYIRVELSCQGFVSTHSYTLQEQAVEDDLSRGGLFLVESHTVNDSNAPL